MPYRILTLRIVSYVALAAIILWQLLLPGYLIVLDMAWSTNIPLLRVYYGIEADPITLLGFPFNIMLWLLNQIMLSDLLQKILLFAVFFLSGLGAHRLCPSKSEFGRYFAGILYAVNPFVYTRFMVGHLGLLLAYAILPYTINSALKLLKQQSLKNSVELVLLLTLNLILDIHFVFILGLLVLFLVAFRAMEIGWRCSRLLIYLALTALIYTALNLYWLKPSHRSQRSQ